MLAPRVAIQIISGTEPLISIAPVDITKERLPMPQIVFPDDLLVLATIRVKCPYFNSDGVLTALPQVGHMRFGEAGGDTPGGVAQV